MPWNDTAQIDFLNPEAREAVIRTIIGVCQQFSIVRFDAAMTLAKRHIQRLWFPAPGSGGAIASRAEHAITTEEFNRRIPNEFWREVVDRCASEAPNTLLLAEAFWMMEGYFVRTLGMHRVYNSAFMNMLKNEENAKYRATIKNTLEFDPEILKRFVNFMNNPDEETAVAQFGKGDKYFGICTLLVTMPGLPMFGHGQIEGFEEKYGMEYRRAYRDEEPDTYLVNRHEREIFPLMKRRALFSGSANFRLYDLSTPGGPVNENVFAYSNRVRVHEYEERSLIFYNNSYYETSGWIRISDPAIPQPDGGKRRDDLCEALGLHRGSLFFTLLREQKSNLWFIRSSKEISENGLFVGLRGYETQVFLDMYEVEDDARGRWGRLHHELQGRGTADPQAAIMDIYLGELYYRFTELLRPEIVTRLHAFFVEGPGGEPEKSFMESLEAPAEAFFETASRFIAGANGAYEPWTAKDADGLPLDFKQVPVQKIRDEFAECIGKIISISAYAGLPQSRAKTPAERFLGNVAGQIRDRQFLCAAALGYGLLSILRPIIGEGTGGVAAGALAVSLGFDHWRLDRKLRDLYRAIGASDDEAWRLTGVSRAALCRIAPEEASPVTTALFSADIPFDPGRAGTLFIEENYQYEDFRRLLGINTFDDITWFNKEGFESSLFYGTLFFVLESDEVLRQVSRAKAKPAGAKKGVQAAVKSTAKPLPWLERVTRIGELNEALINAEAKSGYRLHELLDVLAGAAAVNGVKGKTASKKKTETRSAAKNDSGTSAAKSVKGKGRAAGPAAGTEGEQASGTKPARGKKKG
jgi:hypothetical protein